MLKNIKVSFFFMKKLFSLISEEQKLELIRYNKEFQKIFLVDIEDYKKISGKYKKGERNGKGKEYIINTKNLKFEGEYLNGKRNGEGKEYHDNGKLEFEGEYLNGKRNGEGKEYYDNGELKFEGEYLNGKRWNGKGYNINGNIEYEIKIGNGKVKEYNKSGKLEFEGQ